MDMFGQIMATLCQRKTEKVCHNGRMRGIDLKNCIIKKARDSRTLIKCLYRIYLVFVIDNLLSSFIPALKFLSKIPA